MTIQFGGQTVTLRSSTDGEERDELNQPIPVVSDATWSGVLMRPLSGRETVQQTDVATQEWRCTGPPTTASVAATAADQLVYDGNTYQISTVEVFPGPDGRAHHVRITCQRQAP